MDRLGNQPYDGVYWPLGSRGSFALMGNHEMLLCVAEYWMIILYDNSYRMRWVNTHVAASVR